VGAIVDPFAGCGDPLAGGDRRGMANDGHQIAVAARLRPENAEAVLAVVEGDPLDQAGEYFLSRWLRTGPHADCQNIPSYLSARSCDIASRTRQQPCLWTTVFAKAGCNRGVL
jgi:hypothetical protein